MMHDRPFSQPGAEIAAQAFDRYGDWLEKYCGYLEDVEPEDRPFVYGHWCDGIDIDTAVLMVN